MNSIEANKKTITQFWSDLYEKRNYDKCGNYFADDGLYRDVPAPDNGAIGPKAIATRLRIGLDPIDKHVHHMHLMIGENNTVITEHTEDWHFKTGEIVSLPFVSVQTFNDNAKLKLWSDYWDLNTLLGNAPKWWLDHIANFSEKDFGNN